MWSIRQLVSAHVEEKKKTGVPYTLRTMHFFASFLRPGFLIGAISSLANAFPKASPHPILKAPAVALFVGALTADDANPPTCDAFAEDAGQGKNALTQETLRTRATSTRVKFIMPGGARGGHDDNTTMLRYLHAPIPGTFEIYPVMIPPFPIGDSLNNRVNNDGIL